MTTGDDTSADGATDGAADRAHRAVIRIDASPSVVFPYLTDPALLVRWMGDWADLDPVTGGRFVVDINGVPVRGTFVDIDPPHRVVVTWGVAGHATLTPGSTVVEITLRADQDGTVVELVHRNLPLDELPRHRLGWDHFLTRLALAASGRDAGRDPWADRQ